MRHLPCADAPCGSCPYRRDTPPGVWDATEYEKLRQYTGPVLPALAVFLCHQTTVTGRESVCRGWLTVERESIAVRLAVLQGVVTPLQVYAPVKAPLYETGEEAAEAGLAAVENPSSAARRLCDRLIKKGVAKP